MRRPDLHLAATPGGTPEMRDLYKGAVVARPALLEHRGQSGPGSAVGTFVAVGTHTDPFDRLLRIVDGALEAGVLPGPARAQTGSCSYVPRHMASSAWLAPSDLREAIDEARYVVTHAGSGLISRCLRRGIKPMVLPRLAANGEHVDDHQMQIARRLEEAQCIVLIDGAITERHRDAADLAPPAAQSSELPAKADVVRSALQEFGRGA